MKGAAGYDIFFSKCGKGKSLKLVGSVSGNRTFRWTKTRLKKRSSYKAVVRAYVMKNGKKTYVRSSPTVHAYTSGFTKRYTNPKSVTVTRKSVTLKAGTRYSIKAGVTKLKKGKRLIPSGHAPKLRYLSSNRNVAVVSGNGTVTAKGKGRCSIYVYAVNGVSNTVTVTVR